MLPASKPCYASLTEARVHALVAAVAAFLVATPAGAGEVTLVDGVAHVQNPATPSRGTETLHLQEVWRAGGAKDEEVFFGLISDVCGDEQGNCYALDAQLCQVHVYSPEGRRLRTLFRQGEGPGEVESPRDMVLLGDGSVGLAEEFPGKIVRMDRTGNPLSSIVPGSEDPTRGGWVSLIMACCRGDHLICTGAQPGQNDRPGTRTRIYFLASFAAGGREEVRYLQTQNFWDFSKYVFSERLDTPPFWWGAEVGPDGRVYAVADRDRYAISVFHPDGTLERVIERDFQLWKRMPAEYARMRLLFESAVGGLSIPYTIDVEAYEPAISYWHRPLHLAADGTLWVVSSRGIREQADGIMLTYDVFDPEGHFIRQVAMACEGNGVDDALFFLDGDGIVLVRGYLDALAAQFGRGSVLSGEEEEHTVPEIVYYRVPPSH